MAFLPLIGAGISGLGSALGGLFGRQEAPPAPQWLTPPETKLQKTQRTLIDDLLASLKGKGSFNDLFSTDDAAFQRSFVKPSIDRFNNQIAPQIQQQYIASGQQRGSGLEDALLRAGVDLNTLADQNYLQFQQNAQNRQQDAIARILAQQGAQPVLTPGLPGAQSSGSALGQGFAGYLTSNGFRDDIGSILNLNRPRKGFENNNGLGG